MKSIPRAGIYLDTRHQDKDNLYPLKVRVTYQRKARFYKTHFRLTETQFKKSYGSKSPQGKLFKLKQKLIEIETNAREIIDQLHEFSFSQFQKAFYQLPGDGDDVYRVMDLLIQQYKDNSQLTSAEHYRLTKAKLQSFFGEKRNKPSFKDITPDKLKTLHKHMIGSGCDLGTVGVYMRCMRRSFNYAINQNIITQEFYPFKTKKKPDYYQIPEPINRKRALSIKQLRDLLSYQPIPGTATERGYNMWLLSFYCNGANLHDLLRLRHRDLSEDKIQFRRDKGKNAKNIKSIDVKLRTRPKDIIEKYAIKSGNPNDLLFPYLKKDMNEEEKKRITRNFTRSVSSAMKRIARDLGLPKGISTIWSRHSYATLAKNQGASKEYISESLGHASLSTTDSYLGSFSDEIIEKETEKIYGDLES